MLTDMPIRGTRDRALLLKALPTFARLDDATVRALAEHARHRRFRAESWLVRPEDMLSHAYLVLDGKILVHRPTGNHVVVERPYGVGFLNLMAGERTNVSAVAQTDVETLELPCDAILDVMDDHFSMVRNSLRLQASAVVRHRQGLPIKSGEEYEPPMGEYRDRPSTLVEILLNLQQGALAKVNLDALVEVARRTKEHRVDPGHRFWDAGAPALSSLRIEYGHVRCETPDGAYVDVGAGYVLGGLDSMAGTARSFSATAVTKVIGFELPQEVFLGVMETHREMGRALLEVFSRMLLNR